MPRIVRSVPARRDLAEIWSYIADRNRTAADRLLETFDAKLRRIAEAPGIGHKREELAPGLRSFAVGNYLIFYRRIDDGIELVRVLHGARNLVRQFGR